MTNLVDTDYVASYLKGRAEAEELISGLAPDGLAISLISFYDEINEGICYGCSPEAREEGFLRFVRAVTVLPLNSPIMRRLPEIRGELRRRGQLIETPTT